MKGFVLAGEEPSVDEIDPTLFDNVSPTFRWRRLENGSLISGYEIKNSIEGNESPFIHFKLSLDLPETPPSLFSACFPLNKSKAGGTNLSVKDPPSARPLEDCLSYFFVEG